MNTFEMQAMAVVNCEQQRAVVTGGQGTSWSIAAGWSAGWRGAAAGQLQEAKVRSGNTRQEWPVRGSASTQGGAAAFPFKCETFQFNSMCI